MTQTTDGRVQVWIVLNGDGCECVDFIGAFEAEESAKIAAARIESLIRKYYANHMHGLEWHGYVEVKAVMLGEYELPSGAAYVEDHSNG